MARYRKIEVRTWTDEKFAKLSDAAKLVFLHLLTGHHTTNLPAAFLATEESLQSFSGMGFETHSKGLREVFRNGLATADFDHKLVFLPNGFRHNPPENPNVAKGWVGRIEELPDCDLKAEVIRSAIQAVTDAMADAKPKAKKDFETVLKRFQKGLETLSKPRAVAGAVTGARTEAGVEALSADADAAAAAAPLAVPTPAEMTGHLMAPDTVVSQPTLAIVAATPPPFGPSDLQALWNATADRALPRCAALAGDRLRHTKARLQERPTADEWRKVIRLMNGIPGMLGKVPPRNPGQKPWRADFDFLVSPMGAAKVLEGKYDGWTEANSQPVSSGGTSRLLKTAEDFASIHDYGDEEGTA